MSLSSKCALCASPQSCASANYKNNPSYSTGATTASPSSATETASVFVQNMTSILTNIAVNFSRKTTKRGPGQGTGAGTASNGERSSTLPRPSNVSTASQPLCANTFASSTFDIASQISPSSSPYESNLEDVACGGGMTSCVPMYVLCVNNDTRDMMRNYHAITRLPAHSFDKLEWLAYHTSFLIRLVGMLWMCDAELSQRCQSQCTCMSAPANTQHVLYDDRGKKSHVKYSATAFIHQSLDSLDKCVLSEAVFPSKYGIQFGNEFVIVVKRCCRSLFQILSHLLHAHFVLIREKALDHSLLELYCYLTAFVRHFALIDNKELLILSDLEEQLSNWSS